MAAVEAIVHQVMAVHRVIPRHAVATHPVEAAMRVQPIRLHALMYSLEPIQTPEVIQGHQIVQRFTITITRMAAQASEGASLAAC